MPECPYKGLVPYEEPDAPFFFGREEEREVIIANLFASRLTLLYGTSGVGKSSVLGAGVIRHLRAMAADNLRNRGIAEFAPVIFNAWRDDPMKGFAQAAIAATDIVVPDGDRVQSLHGDLRSVLAACSDRVGGELLIILDQFEEYFLYHPNEDGEGTFAVEFPRLVGETDLRLRFLISLREDSLAKLDRFEGRIPNLFSNLLRIDHLDAEAARDAVEKPLAEFNRRGGYDGRDITIEAALVSEVLAQIQSAELPLGGGDGIVDRLAPSTASIEAPYLQLVMTRLWNEELHAGSTTLRLETLRRLGGAATIVKTHLDRVMKSLSRGERDIARRTFQFLVTQSGTKVAHTVPDLADYANIDPAKLRPLLERLSASQIRLLRPIAPSADGQVESRYEIFHDVLAPAVLAWRTNYLQQRLQSKLLLALTALIVVVCAGLVYAFWVTSTEAEARAAREAEERQRATDERLAEIHRRETAERYLKIAENERTKAVSAEKLAREAQQQAENAQRRALGLVAERDLALENADNLARELARSAKDAKEAEHRAVTAHGEAVVEMQRATSQELAAAAVANLDADPELSLLLALEAVNRGLTDKNVPAPETEDALRRALHASRIEQRLAGHTGPVYDVTVSSDQRWAASASDDATVKVWDLSSPRSEPLTLRGPRVAIAKIAMDPAGAQIATAGRDGRILIWDAATRKPLRALRAHNDRVTDLSYSGDGTRLVSTSEDGTALVWNPATGIELARFGESALRMTTAAFAPDGRLVASGRADGTVILWDATSSRTLTTISAHEGAIRGVAFNLEGSTLVTCGDDKTVKIWDLRSGALRREIASNDVRSIALSRDGTTLLAAGLLGTTEWDASTGEQRSNWDDYPSDATTSVAFSADGRQILTVSAASEFTVRTRATGESRQFGVPDTSLSNAAFGTDGKHVITASNDGVARVWDLASGQEQAQFEHEGAARDVAFSPRDATLVISGAGGARVWDVENRRQLYEISLPQDTLWVVGFDAEGKTLRGISGEAVTIWDAESGSKQSSATTTIGTFLQAQFSADGTYIGVTYSDGTAKLYDVRSGDVLLSFIAHEGMAARVIAFSPDRTHFATVSENRVIRIWRLPSETLDRLIELKGALSAVAGRRDDRRAREQRARLGRDIDTLSEQRPALLRTLEGHTNMITEMAFSPTGSYLATVAYDSTVRVWPVAAEAPPLVLRGDSRDILSVAFGTNPRQLVTGGSDQTVRVWDVSPQRGSGYASTGSIRSIAFTRDGRRFVTASADGVARIWDGASGALLSSMTRHKAALWAVQVSPDGSLVATAGEEGVVHVWSIDTPAKPRLVASLEGHTGRVMGLGFSPDSAYLASGSSDGQVKIWNMPAGTLARTILAHGGVNGVSFNHAGTRFATAGEDNTIKIWHAASGEPLRVLNGHRNRVNDVLFTADDRRLVSASDDHTAKIWDVESGDLVGELIGHTNTVKALSFSSDMTLLATASFDMSTKIWDLQAGREKMTLTGHTHWVRDVAFSPDGKHVATGSEDRTVRFYPLDVRELVRVATARLTRGFTERECHRFLHRSCGTNP